VPTKVYLLIQSTWQK